MQGVTRAHAKGVPAHAAWKTARPTIWNDLVKGLQALGASCVVGGQVQPSAAPIPLLMLFMVTSVFDLLVGPVGVQCFEEPQHQAQAALQKRKPAKHVARCVIH
jgi:hypothetical protein